MNKLIFIKLFVACVLLSTAALAQGANPFARTPFEPEPEPVPKEVNSSPVSPPIPPSSQQQQPSVDYGIELQSLQLVALRNNVAVLRGPESVFFVKSGEEFLYNGASYNVDITGSTLKLKIAGFSPEDEALEVYERQIGRSISSF